jgi:hypothetical protein
MRYLIFLLILPILIFCWTEPINLSQNPLVDINPQGCRIWNLSSFYTCLVWQRGEEGLYNIIARFSTSVGEWGREIPITNDSLYSNENPVVAYDERRNKVWVAWQKNIDNNWEIFVTSGDPVNGFELSYRLTSSPAFDINPTILVISDTVWVVWERESQQILAKFYNGENWSESLMIDFGNDSFVSEPKLAIRYHHPLVIFRKWSRYFSHIYYSEYLNGQWTSPRVVCDVGHNYNVEINGQVTSPPGGVIIVWHNLETNDIFKTGFDSFNYWYPVTRDSNIVDNYPTILFFDVPVFNQIPIYLIAWQRGNGIYSQSWWGEIFPVDTTFFCEKPCLTAMDFTCIWCLYQKNINGNYEIFGSYVYYSGIYEQLLKKDSFLKKKIVAISNQPVNVFDKYKIFNPLGQEIISKPFKAGVYFLIKR